MTSPDDLRAWLDEAETHIRNARTCAPFVTPPDALLGVLHRADRLLALARCGAELAREAKRLKGWQVHRDMADALSRWDAAAGASGAGEA